MGPPQRDRGGGIDIEACARPIAVDHRIKLPYYFRIADNLLRQAKIYRDEKNLVDLYVILLRYSSLICETIPKHRDYLAFKSREVDFFRLAPHNQSKLVEVLSELESLKPVVQRQIAEHNKAGGGAIQSNSSINGTLAVNNISQQHMATPYTYQPSVGCNNGQLQRFVPGGNHQVAPLMSAQPDRRTHKQHVNLPFPKEETLARHSILGPNGLHGQWMGPVTAIKVQYPSNLDLIKSDVSSLLPSVLNQDGQNGLSAISADRTQVENDDMISVLSLDDGRWSKPAEECTSVPSAFLEEELSQLSIRQPSPPPILAELERKPIAPSEVADPRPGLATPETGRYQNLHVPVKLMECFLRVAEANTKRGLETCGVLAGTLKKRTFYVTALIIPKQKSTSDSCEATNEDELFDVQDKGSLFTLGWIHTHPTQSCFLSSIDLHNQYSYQVMLPEAIAIVMAPTDTRKHGIFHLTDPGGMGVIHDCPERGFHPHEAPLDGSPIYEHCSHVYMNPDVKFDVIDLR
ncbi:AMSH-like ubiquitin thioesterase 3 [Oryza brachyantha]|uniref:MPN domain-containing protein n=1 Tax=Oryza brachyantha TaxID=4533 RepID=J3KZI3_ORYBR|nr:AMSH-like ubiquitin thioesterase 3 [Oryza brachyantha]